MHITMVKKILRDGSPCRKCREVEERLLQAKQMSRIDTVLVADERDPASDGMLLAASLGVSQAPFFVVEHDDGRREVYTIYLKFAREVLNLPVAEQDELKEILRDNPDIDFL
jgi:hypothetical protein